MRPPLSVRSATLAEALAFARSAPLVSPHFVARALGSLCRGDDARWAVADADGLRLVGVILDTCDSRDDVAELLPVGGALDLDEDTLGALLAHAEAVAAAGPRTNLDITVDADRARWVGPLVARGYQPAYQMSSLRREPTPVDEPVVAGLTWEPVTPATAAELWSLVGAAFADLPGAMRAPLDEFVAHVAAATPAPELLLRDGRAIGFVRVGGTPTGAEVRSLGVHPAARGGLGEVVLRRALAACLTLAPAEITLDVATTNTRALSLYLRNGFVPTAETTTWRRGLPR